MGPRPGYQNRGAMKSVEDLVFKHVADSNVIGSLYIELVV